MAVMVAMQGMFGGGMGEMIEEVDASGRPTGRAVPRNVIHREGMCHRTVHVWVVNGRGDVLLQRRAARKENYPGLWDISAAGHISFGETSREAAQKELLEELGLAVGSDDLDFVATLYGEAHLNRGSYIDREWADVYILCRDIASDALTLQIEEVDEVCWVPLAELARRVEGEDGSLVPHPGEYPLLLAELFRRAVV